MNIPLRINKKSGFTLLEVLIALVIFSVGILGVATMQISSIQGNSKGRQISEASNVAAERLEGFLPPVYGGLWPDDWPNNRTFSDGAGATAGVAGLNDITPADGADDRDGDGVNDVFWNVAQDYPIPGINTIRIIVDPQGNGPNLSMDLLVMEPI